MEENSFNIVTFDIQQLPPNSRDRASDWPGQEAIETVVWDDQRVVGPESALRPLLAKSPDATILPLCAYSWREPGGERFSFIRVERISSTLAVAMFLEISEVVTVKVCRYEVSSSGEVYDDFTSITRIGLSPNFYVDDIYTKLASMEISLKFMDNMWRVIFRERNGKLISRLQVSRNIPTPGAYCVPHKRDELGRLVVNNMFRLYHEFGLLGAQLFLGGSSIEAIVRKVLRGEIGASSLLLQPIYG